MNVGGVLLEAEAVCRPARVGLESEMRLNVNDHRRDIAGLQYVYPVVSRRAGGVSVGVNLNPNNACNWRCVYCQVPDLVRGAGPEIDLARLRSELDGMLGDIVDGDYLEKNVDPQYRRLKDIAISGNGESTSSPQFEEAVELIGDLLQKRAFEPALNVVLITNGSLAHKAPVQRGLKTLARIGGEVWFKLDTATDQGLRGINDASTSVATHLARLRDVAALCPTWIQTCLFARNGAPPNEVERAAYLDALRALVADETPLRGVHLYGLARASMRPEADELSALPEAWMSDMKDAIAETGLSVRLSL